MVAVETSSYIHFAVTDLRDDGSPSHPLEIFVLLINMIRSSNGPLTFYECYYCGLMITVINSYHFFFLSYYHGLTNNSCKVNLNWLSDCLLIFNLFPL